MKKNKILSLGMLMMMLVACKSPSLVSGDGKINPEVTAKQLIKESGRQATKLKTLQAKVKINIIDNLNESGYTVNLRIEKDKTIWINASLGLARAMITPNKVQFYDRINNQYFDGDYALLSDLLGVELNYEKVQNLLLGQPLFNLKNDTWEISNNESSYILQPKPQDPLLELFLLFNPSHFRMDSQQLAQPIKKRILQIDYTDYQKVDAEILPQQIKIIAVEDSEEMIIELEYRSLSVNEEVRFPFNIPSGFKEINLDDVK